MGRLSDGGISVDLPDAGDARFADDCHGLCLGGFLVLHIFFRAVVHRHGPPPPSGEAAICAARDVGILSNEHRVSEPMRVAIYHNILWSKYKGVVFSRVHSDSEGKGILPSFIQIAETEEMRVGLGSVDMSYHKYPFRLLFRGSIANAPLLKRRRNGY